MSPHTLRFGDGKIVSLRPDPRPRRPHGCLVLVQSPGRRYTSAAWYRTGREAVRTVVRPYQWERWELLWDRSMTTIREEVARGEWPDSV